MQPWINSPSFVVEKPKTDVFAPVGGWNEKIDPKTPWQIAPPKLPSYHDDENLKKAFGIELAKVSNPLDAASQLAPDDITKALWISFNWLHDAIVIASRDIYLKTLETSTPVLDRQQLAAKALAIADEKILKNGVFVSTVEPKDRLAAIRLYSDIVGYTGKVEIDNSNNKTTINEMTIKLVKPEEKKPVIIDNASNIKSENVIENPSPIVLKLVGGASR